MAISSKLSLVLPLTLAAACSPAGVVPNIELFSTAVVDLVETEAKTAVAQSLEGRVAAARRKDFASEGVRYSLTEGGGCDYSNPSLQSAPFSETCALIPMALDRATDEVVTVASEYDTFEKQQNVTKIIAASDQDLLTELLASQLRTELMRYAKQIQTLATATEPSEVSSALGNTFDALGELQDTAKRFDLVNGSDHAAKRAANRTLLTTISSEALEARRYALLKEIVGESEPFVQAATRQLAVVSYKFDNAGLKLTKREFDVAVEGQATVSTATLEAVETQFADLSKANADAAFQKYLDVGRAHSAIVAVFAEPESLEQLTAANARIRGLAEAIRAVD